MTELPASLTGLQRALARGEYSVAEALRAQRQRLQECGADLHCVVQACTGPQDDAAKATGALAGIAVAHKDIFDLAGWRPGLGRDSGAAVAGLRPATAVARLAGHGATQVATLAMAEYACGATAANPSFPRCVNPLRAGAVVGGSSSGSAVAVASELVYGSLGTDTAGSVRIPAATCGVLGLKTTHGRVPNDGVFPLAPSLDSVGVLARSAVDAQVLLDAVAPRPQLGAPADQPLRLRAWIPDSGVDAQVRAAIEGLLPECAIVQRIDDWPEFATVSRRAECVLHAEAGQTHATALREGKVSSAVREVALPGVVLPPSWYVAALAERGRRAQAFVREQLADCDLFLLPALAAPVPDWGEVTPGDPAFASRHLLGLYRFMGFANYLGLPAIVLPIAADNRGMPISVQLVARPFHERALLAFAATVQTQRFDGHVFTRHFHPGN